MLCNPEEHTLNRVGLKTDPWGIKVGTVIDPCKYYHIQTDSDISPQS